MTTAKREYEYRNTKVAVIWIAFAIAAVVITTTVVNLAQTKAQVLDNLASARNSASAAIVQPVQATMQPSAPACFNGGAPVYDSARCAVPTATTNRP